MVSGPFIGSWIKTGVLVGIRNIDLFAGGRHVSGNSHSHFLPDLFDFGFQGNFRPDLLLISIHQIEGTAIRIHQVGDLPHDDTQQFIQMQRTAQCLANLLDGVDFPFFLLKPGLQILKYLITHGMLYVIVQKLLAKYTMPNRAGKFLFAVPGPYLINQAMSHSQWFGDPIPLTAVENQLNRILKSDLMSAGNKNRFYIRSAA